METVQKLSKIDKLKDVRKAKTSENLFYLNEPVEHQCPKFDSVIKDINEAYKLTQLSRYDDTDSIDFYQDRLGDIDWLLRSKEDEINELRAAIEDVRSWGQDWKDVAKSLIECNDVDLSVYEE